LLKKLAGGMERLKPWWRENEKQNKANMWKEGKKVRKAAEAVEKDLKQRLEKKGFAQAVDKSFHISSWSIPFATWDSKFVVHNEGHSLTNVLRHQLDPG
jgi:hypothetical protein